MTVNLSWFASADESWVETNLSDVVTVKQPAEEALQTETVAAMRLATVHALISVPVVRSWVDAFALVACRWREQR